MPLAIVLSVCCLYLPAASTFINAPDLLPDCLFTWRLTSDLLAMHVAKQSYVQPSTALSMHPAIILFDSASARSIHRSSFISPAALLPPHLEAAVA